MKKVNFLLPMKGHSERVPNKNMKLFVGKPLYHLIMDQLFQSKFLNKIYINTDSEIIANDVKKNYPDSEIIWRPKELVGDFVSMNRIIEYDLAHIDGDLFLQTHSTNPLLTVNTIDKALDLFLNQKHDCDSVFSVTKWQTRFYWQDGNPINHNPQELLRTQDLPPMFEENSNFYIFTKKAFKASGGKRIGVNPHMFEMPPMEAIDIDTEFNFNLAEHIYNTINKIQ